MSMNDGRIEVIERLWALIHKSSPGETHRALTDAMNALLKLEVEHRRASDRSGDVMTGGEGRTTKQDNNKMTTGASDSAKQDKPKTAVIPEVSWAMKEAGVSAYFAYPADSLNAKMASIFKAMYSKHLEERQNPDMGIR